MNAIPLVLMEGATISPNQEKVVNAKLQVTDPALQCKPIQGDVVTWITTNKIGYPFVPVVSEYIANKTSIGFRNDSVTTQSLQKGQVISYLDLRSKDSSLAKMQWLIPMNHNLHDYIFIWSHVCDCFRKASISTKKMQRNN